MTTDTDRRTFIETVRHENEQDFGPKAQRFVQKMLSAGLPHPWTYVYELTQNAADAGARRVAWQINGDGVLFQHDGDIALDEQHVRGIASLGASTKGLAAIGFMGVGFKSVFARFLRARVSGFGWRFKFDVRTAHGDLDSTVPQWFDTLRPLWDEDAPNPEDRYTTAFLLERPAESDRPVAADIGRLASPEDPTPLAVLALRGLQQVRVGSVMWDLVVDDGVVEVRRSESETVWRWRSFVSRYRPNDNAMRRFLEVRQETQDHVGHDGQRVEREVVALLPLNKDGLPNPPQHGTVYSTLPTQAQLPFGFHLQADWLVDVDRQNLREIDGDPWQEGIVRQVPEIVRQLLVWLTGISEAARNQGYRVLRDPRTDDGFLSKAFQALHHDFASTLSDQIVIPVHGVGPRRFRSPDGIARLPNRFLVDFGRRPLWRPDLLFGCDLMDEALLTKSATGFATWLGWGREVEQDAVPWRSALPEWWAALPEDQRADALFALWHGVGECEWHDAPVVPTEAGEWVPARHTRWLNEEPPTEKNPSGSVIASALAGFLPREDERVTPDIRVRVNRTNNAGTRWLESRHQNVELASLVRTAFEAAERREDLPLVELVEWAMSRGDRRQDLVPWVLTEKGVREPEDALLADPLVEAGESRRNLFPDKPALIERYAGITDPHAVVLFLERMGVCGGRVLEVKSISVGRYGQVRVGSLIGITAQEVESANVSGYTVLDHDFPFHLEKVPFDSFQDWLSREHVALRGMGVWKARSEYYRYERVTVGRKPATWVKALQEQTWLLCTDDQRRGPGDVLLEPDPDFEDAPIAVIDESLATRLSEEGVRFGSGIPKSPVLRRLALRGASDMLDSELASLIREAREHVEAGKATWEDLHRALAEVRLRGVPLLSRVVQRTGTGSGQRSDLDGWVVALSAVEPSMGAEIGDLPLPTPETTTGQQALDFLCHIWERKPSHVEAIRGNLAAAYRYVLDDVDRGELPDEAWRQARDRVHLYGQGNWRPVSRDLVVDDVQSPLIRKFLPRDRSIVASAHLGETPDQVRRVASALGIRLLSAEVDVHPGSRTDDPPCITRLRKLLKALSLLEDRRELREIAFHDTLSLHVDGAEHLIRAYVEDGMLLLVGKPPSFAVEAAGQLVEHFRLSQRGSEIPYLTGALYALEDARAFSDNLEVLADGLGVKLPEGTPEHETDEKPTRTEEPEPIDQQEGDPADPDEPDRDERRHVVDENDRHVHLPHREKDDVPIEDEVPVDDPEDRPTHSPGASKETPPAKDAPQRNPEPDSRRTKRPSQPDRPSPRGRAADHFGLLVKYGRADDPESVNTPAGRGGPKDDHKARRAVIEYETSQGRQAEAMPDLQPGFDVCSVDPSTGNRRRIEVKGVQGTFEEDASVVLTARQVHDALGTVEDGMEYWLYVVDSTETACPRVFPIPWTQYRTRLRYGFYARAWAGAAEQPAGGT